MLPRYDENHRLVGVLKAETMTLVNDETDRRRDRLHRVLQPGPKPARPHRSRQAPCSIKTRASLDADGTRRQSKSDRINASGSGLYYAFEQGEGFLLGPATTWISSPHRDHHEHSSHHRSAPPRLLGMSLLAQSLAAAPPPPVTAEETAALQADAASKAAEAQRRECRQPKPASKPISQTAADAVGKAVANFSSRPIFPPSRRTPTRRRKAARSQTRPRTTPSSTATAACISMPTRACSSI